MESFDLSSELMNKDKGDLRLVDLEDEDNVAMADQAAEGIDEYFIRLTVGSSLTNKYQTVDNLSPSQLASQNISIEEEKKEMNSMEAECEPEPTLVSKEGVVK